MWSELRDKLKAKKEIRMNIQMLLLAFFFNFFLIIFDNSILFAFGFYISLIMTLFVCLVILQKFQNIKLFFKLSLLVIVIFPLFHEMLFRYTKNNYEYSDEYLNHIKYNVGNALIEHKNDDVLIEYIKSLPKTIRDTSLLGIHEEMKFNNKNGYIIIDPHEPKGLVGGGIPRPKTDIIFYNSDSIKIATIKLTYKNINGALKDWLKEKAMLQAKFKNPKLDIHFFDIWLDSLTVFVFSNLKPIGRVTQILQLLQVFASFIFIYMLTSLLDNFKQLKITKIT